MPRQPATPPAPPADPLADLRPAEHQGPPPEAPPEPEAIQATHSQEWHRDSTLLAIGAWHKDTVSAGFLHGGGVCGCRHLATLALRAIHGAPQDPTEAGETEGPQ